MKNIYRKINRKRYSLGELIAIVNSCCKDSREANAAIADLLDSGRVLLKSHGHYKRVRVNC